jgi:hypothetical protein
MDDRSGEGTWLGNLGLVYSDQGEPRKAIEFLKESLAVGESIEDLRIIRFCEQKLKELEVPENSEGSNNPPLKKNIIQTFFNKWKSKK